MYSFQQDTYNEFPSQRWIAVRFRTGTCVIQNNLFLALHLFVSSHLFRFLYSSCLYAHTYIYIYVYTIANQSVNTRFGDALQVLFRC